MSPETCLHALEGQLKALLALLSEIRIAVCEDHPASPDLALVDHRSTALDDLIAQTEEAIECLTKDADTWVDRKAAGRILAQVHRHFNSIHAHLWSDLMSHERILEMTLAAGRHGGEWVPWVRSVQSTIRRCPELLFGISGTVLACWEDVSEGSGSEGIRAVAMATVGGRPTFQASSSNA
jgi:hypothetical protein